MKEGRVEQAVKHFAKYGTPLISTNFDLYDRLASEVLRRGRPDAIASLRDMVFKLVLIF